MSKKLKVITISMCDEDVEALDSCIELDPVFPPTRAELICVLARNQIARLLSGEDQLKHLYEKWGISPVSVGEVSR